MSLTLVLNGQSRTFPSLFASATLDLLVAELGFQGDRVAVEHNGEIVSRSRWVDEVLLEGDRLEVVHFVGGGTQGGLLKRCVTTFDSTDRDRTVISRSTALRTRMTALWLVQQL